MSADALSAELLKRKAIVYVRQSTQTQVQTNLPPLKWNVVVKFSCLGNGLSFLGRPRRLLTRHTYKISWFEPPRKKYVKSGFEVAVNPELGLDIGGKQFVIKLHMNVDPLTQPRADLMIALMSHVLAPSVPPTITMSALDMRRSKLIVTNSGNINLMPQVDAVLDDMAAIWPTV